MKAYFISGLGADKKAFYRLKLPTGYEPVYLDWIFPLPKETLSDYAQRFSLLINEKEKFVLVGLSFGGMVASEIAKLKIPEKLILISSVPVATELPWYYKRAASLRLQKIIPAGFYKTATLLNHFMGSKEKEEKVMVAAFVKKTQNEFIHWAISAILGWKNTERFNNVVHIHGSRDRLLPVKYTKADFIVNEGRHLMVWNKAAEINEILAVILPANQLNSN